jgi:hypothetical protein
MQVLFFLHHQECKPLILQQCPAKYFAMIPYYHGYSMFVASYILYMKLKLLMRPLEL